MYGIARITLSNNLGKAQVIEGSVKICGTQLSNCNSKQPINSSKHSYDNDKQKFKK